MTDLPDGTILGYDASKSSHGVTLSIEQFIEWEVLVPVPIEADIAPISGEHCPTCGVVEPHLHVYRWVGGIGETP